MEIAADMFQPGCFTRAREFGATICVLDRVQPTKPIAGTIGEESKPEAGAKRPSKTAQARRTNRTDTRKGEGDDLANNFIGARSGLVKYPGLTPRWLFRYASSVCDRVTHGGRYGGDKLAIRTRAERIVHHRKCQTKRDKQRGIENFLLREPCGAQAIDIAGRDRIGIAGR